jgi:hypothetical protein
MVPAICPGRVTLDRIAGQVANVVGTVDLMGLLMALDVAAVERGVFPDRYILGRPNETPTVIGGRWMDGRSGEANLVMGAQTIGELNSSAGPQTRFTLSDLERSIRLSSGNPSLLSGEANGSIRSGQVVAAMQGVAADPRIQELQEIMEYCLEGVNEAAAQVEKAYFPTTTIYGYTGQASDQVMRPYVPGEVFEESTCSVVRYGMPGIDAARMTVNVAQMVGAGLTSRTTARTIHPYIENADQEQALIVLERLEDAALTSVLQQASAGALPMIDVAEIMSQYRGQGDLVDAIRKAQELAQQRQAQQAPAGGPEMQPGLSLPGAGVEATPAPNQRVGPPTDSQGNLRNLLSALSAGR